jgi:son of sevenless-like protein
VRAEQEAAEAAEAGTGASRSDGRPANGAGVRDTWGAASVNGMGYEDLGEDLTSFSTGGGDIFAEIAAAAAGDVHSRQSRGVAGDQGTEKRPRQRPTAPQSPKQPNSPSSVARHHSQRTASESSPRPMNGYDQSPNVSEPSPGHSWVGWLPRVTDDGQIYYYNQRTGQTALDLPADAELLDQGGEAASSLVASRRPSAAASSISAGSHDSVTAAFYDNLRRKESLAQSLDPSASPTADLLPISEDVGEWQTLNSPDGRVYFQNVETGEERSERPVSRRPAPSQVQSTAPQAAGHPADVISPTSQEVAGSAWSAGHSAASSRASVDMGRLSIYSDDSVLDSDLVPASAKNRSLAAKGKGISRADSGRAGSSLDVLEPSPLPTLGELEVKARYAIAELIECAHPRQLARRTDPVATAEEEPVLDEAEAERERDRLADVLALVVDEVRNLMHSVGALEPATGPVGPPAGHRPSISSLPPRPVLPNLHHDALRPFTRRVTSTLSKLVLSVRAAWGLMAASAKEEASVAATVAAEIDSEEDLALARQMRTNILRARQESSNKLKLDIVVSAREVADEVSRFVDEVERLCGDGVKKASLPAAKAPFAAFKTSAGALLLPGGGYGGNWRGNGYTTLPSSESSYGIDYAYPSKALSIDTAANFARDIQALVEEANQLRAAIEAVPSLEKRASAASRLGSPFSASLAHLTSQASHLLSGIGHLMASVEDMDVASSVDLDLDADAVPGLWNGSLTVDDPKGKSKEEGAPTEAQVQEYQSSVKRAKPLLATLETAKQALYDAAPTLLTALQSRAMGDVSEGSSLLNPSEPPATSPLSNFRPSFHHSEPSPPIVAVLNGVTGTLGTLNNAIRDLASVAQAQASAHRDLRRASIAFRSRLSKGRPDSTYTTSSTALGGSSSSKSRTVDETLRSDTDPQPESAESSADENFFFPGTAMSAQVWRGGKTGGGSVSSLTSVSYHGGKPPSVGSYERESDLPGSRRPSDGSGSEYALLRREEPPTTRISTETERLTDGEWPSQNYAPHRAMNADALSRLMIPFSFVSIFPDKSVSSQIAEATRGRCPAERTCASAHAGTA